MKFEEAKYIFADNKRLYSVEEVTELLEQNVSKGKTYYNGKITHSKQFYFTKKL